VACIFTFLCSNKLKFHPTVAKEVNIPYLSVHSNNAIRLRRMLVFWH